MRKIYFLLVFYFALVLTAAAQEIGNEWINYNQIYYKIPITKSGIYRLTPTVLANSGVSFSNVDPRNFQLFGRGREQAIYVKGENDLDGVFNGNDFIEFYAERNDGWLDSLMYDSASHQTNPFYSLFTDTAFYFLTWNSSFINLRMQVSNSDLDTSSYFAEPYFMRERLTYFIGNYYQGESDISKVTDPEYTSGEGWMSESFDAGSSKTINLKTTNSYLNGPPALLKTTVSAWTNDFIFHDNNHLKISLNANTLLDSTFKGYKTFHSKFSVPLNQLAVSSSNLKIESIDVPGANNPQSTAVAFAQLKYAHTFDLENDDSVYISIPNTILQNKTRIDIVNFNASTPVYLYDLNDRRRITGIQVVGGYKFLFPNFNKNFEGYLTSEAHINQVTALYPAGVAGHFTNYAAQLPAQPDYLIITHKSLLPEVQNYKNYRTSIPGGSHKVLVATTDELYDQYAYGISRNPISMRKFAQDALKNWAKNAQYLFLLGKGVSAADLGHEYFRNDPAVLAQNLVPSFGLHPCDNLITVHIKDSLLFAAAIPTGRLAATNMQDVANYLSKIQQYESAPRAEWMKNVLHFGGGNSSAEQSQFANNLEAYKVILEDTAFGGSIHTFLKTTSAPIQITLSDSVKQLIETGVSLMTFFGHASGSSFDQSIDQPEGYNNAGRYPVVVANSCYSGNIHNPAGIGETRINEDYVLYPNGGAIAFIAQVGQGISQYLHNYSQNLFNHIGRFNYGEPISHSMQRTVLDIQANYLYMKVLCLEMTLHGDPALVLNSFAKPDYEIKPENIYFSSGVVGNNSITASLDSFYLHIKVKNIARATADSSILQVKRIFPSTLTPQLITRTIKGVHNNDEFTFKFPIDRVNGIGLNKFEVIADATNVIDELDNTGNNSSTVDLNIISGFISPVYPYNFAIVPHDTITLIASTFDPLAAPANYYFQLDTNDTFSPGSPQYKTTTINSAGGLLNWKVPLTLTDSMVYYWRVSKDTLGTNQTQFWKTSSFQYINGKTGWSQAHFPQFKNDAYKFLKHNSANRKFELDSAKRTLTCKTFGNPTITDDGETSYSIDGQLQESASCGGGLKVHVAIIDKLTLEPWLTRFVDTTGGASIIYNPTHNFGNGNDNNHGDNCPNRFGPAPLFVYWTSIGANMGSLARLLTDTNKVGKGNYILAYTWEAARPGWANKDSLFDAFSAIGFDSLRYIYDTRPWIYFAKVGDPNSVRYIIGDTGHVEINFETVLRNNRKSGEVYSSLIGPAAQWKSLHWQTWSVEQPTDDNVRIKVLGVKPNGQEDVVLDSTDVFKADLNIQTRIDASVYPFLKFYQFTEDEGPTRSPSQLKRWQVIYDEIPEAAVNPLKAFEFKSKSVQEGDNIYFKVAIQNITEMNMDSLLVRFWLVDKNRIIHELKAQRYKKLLAHDTLVASVSFSSLGFAGVNTLWMEANPLKTNTSVYDQLEQFHFNNFAQVEFTAAKDKANPLLDVTFDGIHIMDGDLVSAKPAITVQLKDESKYLALDNENLVKVFIRYPNQNADVLIPFDANVLRFVGAQLPENRCKVEYNPNLTEDGVYQLIIQARDKSNNRSGDIDYRISFEVENKSTITEVMNYPNPFSTSTRFVFTLTGSEIPQNFRIQIMTVSGKIVREIFQDELGPIHIGRNVSQYAWDGRDNFGDQLANGVYFYRTVTKLNGENIEKRETAADAYFKKGWGKMYLLK